MTNYVNMLSLIVFMQALMLRDLWKVQEHNADVLLEAKAVIEGLASRLAEAEVALVRHKDGAHDA